ncbi:MAG TPA: class I SAM-dependent methyltransferase, partial [Bacteroidales bacterium]|nr:class I SAM-dependent methyltransferase [Bacteroidales bacterium]
MTKLNQFLLYDELPLWSAPFGLTLLETVRLRKNINILDIGSGGGFPMLELAERSGPSCRVYGVDPSEDAAFMIAEKIKLKGIPNAEA